MSKKKIGFESEPLPLVIQGWTILLKALGVEDVLAHALSNNGAKPMVFTQQQPTHQGTLPDTLGHTPAKYKALFLVSCS